jgi:FkbM family methyltransferase
MKRSMRLLQAWLARNRRQRFAAWVDRQLVDLHRGYENHDYEFASNGEARVLEVLAREGSTKTVFDVGANIGEWSRLAAGMLPAATIHAFEIVPATFARLQKNCANVPLVIPVDCGLSDQTGPIPVHVVPHAEPLATAVSGFLEGYFGALTLSVPGTVMTGDAYCTQKGIDHIDFLKIDVEGFEDRVLKGFSRMLAEGRIGMIQFEYGYVNVATHFLLKDFYEFLQPLGMSIGKIYPTYVDFRDYRYEHEDFIGPNFLAVHASRAATAALLAG